MRRMRRLVCLSYFGAVGNPAHVRFLIRRLKRLMPNAKFLAGYWMLGEDPDKGEDWKAAVGAHFVATSLTDAVAVCVREASGAGSRARPLESRPGTRVRSGHPRQRAITTSNSRRLRAG